MLKTVRSLSAVAALATACFSASAAVWTQTLDETPDVLVPPSVTLNFDLTTAGFNPGADLITEFTFEFVTYDDSDSRQLIKGEWVFADLPGLLADGLWTSTGSYSTGASFLGAFSLNATGTLTATVSSILGDFYFDKATLTASGVAAPGGNVPEPGTLALAGLALAALGLRRSGAGK